VTGNETRLANCGQLALRSVDNLWITFIFLNLKRIFWAVGGEGERRVVLYQGTLSSQCGLDDISNSLKNYAKTQPINAARTH
jgi:hypothetical protein